MERIRKLARVGRECVACGQCAAVCPGVPSGCGGAWPPGWRRGSAWAAAFARLPAPPDYLVNLPARSAMLRAGFAIGDKSSAAGLTFCPARVIFLINKALTGDRPQLPEGRERLIWCKSRRRNADRAPHQPQA